MTTSCKHVKIGRYFDNFFTSPEYSRKWELKFLGVIIDEKLSFTRHISYIKNKISKTMGIIIKARKYINKKCIVNLYHSFDFPYLTYCTEIWGKHSH